MTQTDMSNRVVVIGAGVIGLSSAIKLQEAGYSVTIVARDFPGPFETVDRITQINYTSPWGGAHNRWVLPSVEETQTESDASRDHRLSVITFKQMGVLAAAHPEAGITFMKGIEYIEAPTPVQLSMDAKRAQELQLDDFRLLRPDEFPDDKVRWGCEYRTWCVNPMVYCSFLLRKFAIAGGEIVKRELRAVDEVFALPGLGQPHTVVNASGNGFGDPNMFITRGQTCLVRNPCDATVTRQNADGSWTFCVPRNFDGGTIVGGTKEPDNWDSEPSPEVREELLRKFAATYPQIKGPDGEFDVLRDIVGRRPTRHGGIRLEGQKLEGERVVVHAYGLGGRGYELSWGVAQTVVDIFQGLY